jgi:hypothetical protein
VNLLVILFLVVVAAVGYLATLSVGVSLGAEERLVYGVVVGTVIVASVGFAFAWIAGMSRASIIVSMSLSLALVLPLVRGRSAGLVEEWRDLRARLVSGLRNTENPWPLLAITAASAIISGRILAQAYQPTTEGGLAVGHLSTFGDWSAHLHYTASFAYGDNWPPDLPSAAGEPFAYHFGVDWFAAMFVPLGSSVQAGLQISAWFLATAFPGILYVSGRRLVGSRLAAGLGALVFLASGGTAALWRFFYEDLPEEGPGILGALPRAYAFDGFDRNWVDNAVTGFLYPQRPTLIGFAVAAMVLALLWSERGREGSRTHLAAGVLMAVMPVFHVFAYGVLLVMGLAWAVIERTKRWLAFLGPASLGLLIVWWQWPSENGRKWDPLWVVGLRPSSSTWELNVGDWVWFWILNTGVFIPLAAFAFWRCDRERARRFLPIWGLLLLPNIAIWHFWEGNNAKYVLFFLLLAAPFVGEVLARWIKGSYAYRFLATVVVFSLTFSGGLDIWRAFEGTTGSSGRGAAYPVGYFSPADMLVGEWVRDNTSPDSVFAGAETSAHPVRALAGRAVVSGFPGRLRDLGVDWFSRVQDLRTLYGVYEGFDLVIAKYGVDYLVLGEAERRSFRPADAPPEWDPAEFWDQRAAVVYDIGQYAIYDVREYQ